MYRLLAAAAVAAVALAGCGGHAATGAVTPSSVAPSHYTGPPISAPGQPEAPPAGTYMFTGTATSDGAESPITVSEQVIDVDPDREKVVSTSSGTQPGQSSSLTNVFTLAPNGQFLAQTTLSFGGGPETFVPAGPALVTPRPLTAATSWGWTAESTDHKLRLTASYRTSGGPRACSADAVQMTCVQVDYTWQVKGAGLVVTQQTTDLVALRLGEPVAESDQTLLTYDVVQKYHSTSDVKMTGFPGA